MACYWGESGEMAIVRICKDVTLLGEMSIPSVRKNITLLGDRVTWL